MAIESAAHFRRLARAGLSVSMGMLSLVGVARAQSAPAPPPVTSGSVIPLLLHPTNWGQIYTIRVAPTGDVVFLDVSQSGLYQMKAGTNQFSVIASGAPLSASGTYWNEGLAMDAKGTIYIGQRYPSGTNQMLRIPYDPVKGTWDISGTDTFGTNINVPNVGQLSSTELQFIDSPARDGSGTLIVGSEGSNIYAVPVNADGTVPLDSMGNPTVQVIVKSLKADAIRLAVDANENLYLIEAPAVVPTARVSGVFFIPATVWKGVDCGFETSTSNSAGCIVGDGQGSAEASSGMQRIDPITNTEKYDGVTVDPAGNLFLTDESDSYGGSINGVYIVPNESGSATSVTSAAAFNWAHLRYIAPIQSNASVTIDPRGFIWIPTSTSGWQPSGELAVPGTDNFVLWAMGSANMGPSPVGTASPTNTVYYSFSAPVTPGSIGFNANGGANFNLVTTDPNPNPSANPPATPCTVGKTYAAISFCPVWMATTPTVPGSVSSQLSMLDASSNVIGGATTYVYGVGQGPAVSLMVPSMQTAIASGLVTPAQVATDALGNSYVADSGQGKVLEFAAGSTPPSAGKSIGTGLTAPSGVAVDNTGDVYIADSGKVIEIPAKLDGTLNAAGQTVLDSTGLGSNLKLAVDAADNVYIADPDHGRVLKLSNPTFSVTGLGLTTVGSGFTKPTAIAVDNAGDVFVADGATLSEVTEPFSGQASITNSLSAPVTGLSVDPSGSIDIAQAGGIVRIPLQSGAYNANNAAVIDPALTSPNGVAMDPLGNLYVTDVTKGVPNLFQLSLNAYANFGQVGPFVTTDPMDIDVFNIGNEPLSLTGTPTIASTDGADGEFVLVPASQFGCDITGATSVDPGSDCILDVTLTATDLGARTATMTVPTNAINSASPTASLIGTGAGNLCYTTTTFTLNPASTSTYPGTTTASVNVTENLAQTNPPGCTVPTGNAVLTLTPQGGGQTFSFTGTLTPGDTSSTASIPAINLAGGTYTVKVAYKGDTSFFGGSAPTVLFTVTPGTPTVTLTEPSGVTPINGVYYVLLGSDTTLQASVISSLGTPSGTVNFMNGSAIADPTQKNTSLDAAGQATFNADNLPPGTYTITAVSNSTGTDPNFSSATSNPITFQVVPGSALISASPSSLSTTAGNPVQTTLTVQSLVGYNPAGLQMSCVNATLPQYSECTFTVPAIDLFSETSEQSVMTISTNVPVNVGEVRRGASPIAFAGLFGLSLLGLALRRRGKIQRSALSLCCLMAMFAGALIGFTGCTNAGYTHTPPSPHVTTPSGSYQVSVIGIDPKSGAVTTLPFTVSFTVK